MEAWPTVTAIPHQGLALPAWPTGQGLVAGIWDGRLEEALAPLCLDQPHPGVRQGWAPSGRPASNPALGSWFRVMSVMPHLSDSKSCYFLF